MRSPCRSASCPALFRRRCTSSSLYLAFPSWASASRCSASALCRSSSILILAAWAALRRDLESKALTGANIIRTRKTTGRNTRGMRRDSCGDCVGEASLRTSNRSRALVTRSSALGSMAGSSRASSSASSRSCAASKLPASISGGSGGLTSRCRSKVERAKEYPSLA